LGAITPGAKRKQSHEQPRIKPSEENREKGIERQKYQVFSLNLMGEKPMSSNRGAMRFIPK
jgi:hypothetical protein